MIQVVLHKSVRRIRVGEIGEDMDNDLRGEIPLMPRLLLLIKQIYQVAISFTKMKNHLGSKLQLFCHNCEVRKLCQ